MICGAKSSENTEMTNSYHLIQVGLAEDKNNKGVNFLIQTVYDGNEEQLRIRFHEMTSNLKFKYLDEYIVRDFKDREIQRGEWAQGNYLSLVSQNEYEMRLKAYHRVHDSLISFQKQTSLIYFYEVLPATHEGNWHIIPKMFDLLNPQ